jgi:hypothetical protein
MAPRRRKAAANAASASASSEDISTSSSAAAAAPQEAEQDSVLKRPRNNSTTTKPTTTYTKAAFILLFSLLIPLYVVLVPSNHMDLGPTPEKDKNPYKPHLFFGPKNSSGFADLALGTTHYYSLGDEEREEKVEYFCRCAIHHR